MRTTIPKNRILPLIIFAVVGILISIFIGIYHMNKMVQYSYEATNDKYDLLAENTAKMIKNNLENNLNNIQLSALLIGELGGVNIETGSVSKSLLVGHEQYLDYYIVDIEGNGYNQYGEKVYITVNPYYELAKTGLVNFSNTTYLTEDQKPYLYYAAPIYSEQELLGVLMVTVSAQIDVLGFIEETELNGSSFYLLNESNDIVGFSYGANIHNFDYEQVLLKGYKYNKDQSQDRTNISFVNGFQNIRKSDYIWHEKEIGINQWSLLMGRTFHINPITENILNITNSLWIAIILILFILTVFFIVILRKSDLKLLQMLYYDPVTEGDNWYKFRMEANNILNSRQSKYKYAMVNFDINRFKVINDSFGYQKGDEVLKEIYLVLEGWSKPAEPFTRYSADQFFILLSFENTNEIEERLNDLNNRLHQLSLTKTIKFYFGVYYIKDHIVSIDRMGDFASIAKNNIKIKGSNDVIVSYFDENAQDRLLQEEKIEKSMHEALNNNEFVVYLQPKYNAKDEVISGAEALVRWVNKDGETISPGNFVPLFEKNGFVIELDHYMLRKVCEILRGWLDKGYAPVPISVNVSRVHFADPKLADRIKETVDEYRIPHELIEIELSESAFLHNEAMLIKTVVTMRDYGFVVSMDDFGTGYSSLNSLKDIPLDVVKLDGGLFRGSEQAERGQTVIRNTITMAKDLHMRVVAECIETKEQVDFLRGVGCDIIQGYYYAKPMPVNLFENLYFLPN